jgi:hypothetical protein
VTLADDELAVTSDARHSGDDSQNARLELRRGRESAPTFAGGTRS